jgi:hypothetical protein
MVHNLLITAINSTQANRLKSKKSQSINALTVLNGLFYCGIYEVLFPLHVVCSRLKLQKHLHKKYRKMHFGCYPHRGAATRTFASGCTSCASRAFRAVGWGLVFPSASPLACGSGAACCCDFLNSRARTDCFAYSL